MFRHLRPEQIDRAQWDDLIGDAPNGLIYGLSWYLDIVSPGWAALVRQEQGRYVAGLPLPMHRKFGFQYLRQPLFAQQLGLFCRAPPTPADWQQIGQLLRQRFRFVTRYSFNAANTELLGGQALGLPAPDCTTFTTYYLSLRPAYAQLRSGYKPIRRWRLNQARRRGLLVELTTDIDLLVRLFDENTAPKIYGVVGEAYEYRLL